MVRCRTTSFALLQPAPLLQTRFTQHRLTVICSPCRTVWPTNLRSQLQHQARRLARTSPPSQRSQCRMRRATQFHQASPASRPPCWIQTVTQPPGPYGAIPIVRSPIQPQVLLTLAQAPEPGWQSTAPPAATEFFTQSLTAAATKLSAPTPSFKTSHLVQDLQRT